MTRDEINQLKQQHNIIDVAESLGLELKSHNRDVTQAIRCVFHDDNKASMVLQPNTGTFHCMACDESGDTIKLIRKVTGGSFVSAIEYLGGKIEEEQYETAEEYIKSKRLTQETLDEFNIQIKNNKVFIPVPTGMKIRVFSGPNKFAQKTGTAASIFKTKENASTVFMCEGELDAVRVHQETNGEVVAWSSTVGATSVPKHLLKQFDSVERIYIGYDADKAGDNGAEKLAKELGIERCYFVDVPYGKDWNDYFSLGGSKEDFLDLMKKARPGVKSVFDEAHLSFEDIVSLPERGEIYLVDKLIPKGCTIIGAPPKSMKSFMMLHLLQCFSQEYSSLFGHFRIPERKKILLLDRENDPYLIQRRVNLLGIGATDKLIYNNSRQSLNKADNRASLLKYLEKVKPGVVVFDSLVRFLDGDENDSHVVSSFFRNSIDPIKDMGISVIIIHHHGKNDHGGSNRMRGSTDLTAYPDCSIQLQKTVDNNKTFIEVEQTDNRHDEEIEKFLVEIDSSDVHMNFIYKSTEAVESMKVEQAKKKLELYFAQEERLTYKKAENNYYLQDIEREILKNALAAFVVKGWVSLNKHGRGGRYEWTKLPKYGKEDAHIIYT